MDKYHPTSTLFWLANERNVAGQVDLSLDDEADVGFFFRIANGSHVFRRKSI